MEMAHGCPFRPGGHTGHRESCGRGRWGTMLSQPLKLVMRFPDDLTYAEGFAASWFEGQIRPHFGLHAWAVTRVGDAVDPTWPDGIECFGLPFDLDYVARTVVRRREYGAIDNYQEDFPLWAGLETGWRAKWDRDRQLREGFVPYPRRKGR